MTWVHGDATSLVGIEAAADLAVMMGNLAQVFVADEDWYGFDVLDVRDAPDRPGTEMVFVADARDGDDGRKV